MSCENPCTLVTAELKKYGFECSSFLKGLFSGEPSLRTTYTLSDKIKFVEWAQTVINVIKKDIRCPVKFIYVIKYTRASNNKTNLTFDIQMIFRSTKDLEYERYPEKDLEKMVRDYKVLVTAGQQIDTVFKFELTREFINYGPKKTESELDDLVLKEQ